MAPVPTSSPAYTIYDPLVAWELDVADRPGKLIPGLATEWTVNDADKTLWTFKLRDGVKFHDGSAFNADAVVWNLEKVFNKDAPQFDQRQAAQVRPRLPSIASYKKIDDMAVEIKTKAVDALFPYQMLWFLVSSPAQVGEARQGLEQVRVGAVGHRPVQAGPPGAARARRAGEERRLLESQAHPQDRPAGADRGAGGFGAHRGAALELGRHDRDAAARRGGAPQAGRHADRAERDAARLELSSLAGRGLALDRHPPAQGRQPRDRPRRHRQAAERPGPAGLRPGRQDQPVVRQADLRAQVRARRGAQAHDRGGLQQGPAAQDQVRRRLAAAPARCCRCR